MKNIQSKIKFRSRSSEDQSNKREISYIKSLIIGFIHGLAGSAAMVLLTMSTVDTVWQGGLYILIFGVGTTIGMLVFTTILGLPFVLSKKRITLSRSLIMITGDD